MNEAQLAASRAAMWLQLQASYAKSQKRRFAVVPVKPSCFADLPKEAK